MRFGDPRVQALAGALAVLGFAVTGITNKSLRAWMTGLLGQPYSMNQASYDLGRLRANQFIERIGHTNTYRLTADGQAFAIFYSRVHHRALYPLMAADQPIAAPHEVRRALATLARHIDTTIAAAGLRQAAWRPPRQNNARPRPSGQPQTSQENATTKLKTSVKVLGPQGALGLPVGDIGGVLADDVRLRVCLPGLVRQPDFVILGVAA
jgi:hypothetical protein